MSVLFTHRGKPPTFDKLASDFAVGESVFLTLDNTPTEFIVIHQGNPNDDMYDKSCDGTWLVMKDCYVNQLWDDSTLNNYRYSHVHNYLNDELFEQFDEKTKSVIKQVKIPYVNNVGTSDSVASGTNGLATKVFLLGISELGISSAISSYTPLVDGSTLTYFNVVAKRIAKYSGKAVPWWLRSPYNGSDDKSLAITNEGYGAAYRVVEPYGIRPAVIIPSDTELDPDTNTVI